MSIEKINCSISNPCGKNGYCEKNFDDEFYCSCKFWWSGRICNELTNSGIQVIILGCLLTILIGIYYGLIIYKRCRIRKEKKYNFKYSIGIKFIIRPFFFILIILILILGTLGLTIKWFLLKSIHNKIIDQYQHNLSLFYESHKICRIIIYQNYNLILLSISCFLILIFSIEYKRILSKSKYYYNICIPPVPMDFFTNINRTFLSVTFAIAANELLEIVNNVFNETYSIKNGIVLIYLQEIFKVLIMGFRYYPILASVYIDTLISLILGTFYIFIEFSMTIIEQGMCKPRYYNNAQNRNGTYLNILLNYYGTGYFLMIIDLLTDIPRYLCLSYIIIELLRKLRNKFIKNYQNNEQTQEEKVLLNVLKSNSIEMNYLRNLFQLNKQQISSNRWIYQWRNDFRYSSRIICLYSSIFFFLYFFIIQICVQILPYLNQLQQLIQNSNNNFLKNQSNHSLPLFVRPFLLAVIIGSIIIVIQLFLLLTTIRRNLFQVYRGNDSEIPRRNQSNYTTYAIGNFHFAGYLIAYVLWGLVLIIFFIFIFILFIDILITFNLIPIIESILKYFIPILLIGYFKTYLNKFLARFIFLQDNGDVLAINNRRLLMIFLYFNFFLDAFIGLFSSISRLLQSVIGGIIYMCRLDYSPLGRKLETWDDGFSSYCGFIHTECTHRHPVLLIFTANLISSNKKKLKIHDEDKIEETRRRRIIRKWQMIVFLIRNPLFIFYRKAYFKRFHNTENHLISLTNQFSC